MLFDMPSDDVLYDALIARDSRYDGLAYVGVKSTGIFCRLTCSARKPKRENSLFFESIAACMDAGFRPCKRCRPLASAGDIDPLVRTFIDALESDPNKRWREESVSAMGFDPSTVRRSFKRHFGITFLEMARLQRVRSGATTLSNGVGVLEAQLDAGFESGSGFRAAFARILGRPPSELTESAHLNAHWLDTPLGTMIAVADRHALYLLEFFDRKGLPNELKRLQARCGAIGVGRSAVTDQIELELGEYFSGRLREFQTPLTQFGSDFTRTVWKALCNIPPGETRSYGDIARTLGKPTASRAVARANGANQIAILIPCHRVIGSDGSLTGYGGGRWRKQWLIEHERKMASH